MNIDIKKDYGLVNYENSVEFMQQRVVKILDKTENELIWFLNHDHIYTQGTSANKDEILKKIK